MLMLVRAEDRAELAEHAGLVVVARDEQDAPRAQVEAQVVDAHDARLAAEDGAGDAMRLAAGAARWRARVISPLRKSARLLVRSRARGCRARARARGALTKLTLRSSVWRSTPTRKASAQVLDAVARDLAADR